MTTEKELTSGFGEKIANHFKGFNLKGITYTGNLINNDTDFRKSSTSWTEFHDILSIFIMY